MRVGVLRRVDFDGTVVVGAMVGVPVIAGAAGVRMAEQTRVGRLLVDVEQLKADVGVLRVCDHAPAGRINHGVPGVEAGNPSRIAGVDVDRHDAVRPVGRQDLA